MALVSDVTTVRLTGLTHIDALLSESPGWNWLAPARNVINYTFSVTSGNETGSSSMSGPLTAFNSAQQAAALAQMAYISQLTGIQFSLASSGATADLHFANVDLVPSPSTAGLCSSSYDYQYNQNDVVTTYNTQAYVYLDNKEWAADNSNPVAGNAGYETLLHEMGHALGLKHPFEGTPQLPTAQDNTGNTVMSYTDDGNAHSTFSPYDLAALAWLYGDDGLGGALGASSIGRFLIGSASAEVITGSIANDKFQGMGGNDTLSGDTGTDTALFSNNRAQYTVSKNASGFTVAATSGSDGTDTLTGIERLKFADEKLALDTLTTQAGGKSALLVGAVLGKSALTNKALLGNLITYFDSGNSLTTAATALVDGGTMTTLAGGADNNAYVNLIYRAVTGATPTADVTAGLATFINSGGYTKATFLAAVAELPVNQVNVDLVGLQQLLEIVLKILIVPFRL